MRLCRFGPENMPQVGFYSEQRIVPLSEAATAFARVTGRTLELPPSAELLAFLPPDGPGFEAARELAAWVESTGSAFPEFRRIVVASPREVVWGGTLAEALRLLLESEGGNAPPTPTPGPGPTPTPGPEPTPSATPGPGEPLPTDIPGLIDYAFRHNQLAQEALRAGDFARYGEEQARVEAALDRLNELAPGLLTPPPATPTPAP